jgi:RNA recognition motif-containing protein
MSATGSSNCRKPSKDLGPIVPGKLYVTNIKYTMTIESLKSAFAKFGIVDEVDIIHSRGRPLGFGFVTFKNADDAESARKALNGKELDGRKIGVVEYRSRKKDGSAGMARGGDDPEFETGSAISVDVDEGFDIPDHEYIDWNYGLALLSSGLPE